MNQGQKMFHDFFINLVKDGAEAEAENLLDECFKLQDEGKFSSEFHKTVMPKFFALVKPENMIQLKNAMEHFSTKLD